MDTDNKKKTRLKSLDALRGFDMFFITGGAAFIVALATAFGCDSSSWIVRQMGHVPWAGFQHHDTIFPLFLFLAGVSWPFSLASQRAKGRTTRQIAVKVLLRTAILFLLGLSLGGILKFSPTFRIPSVLGFIGLSWGAAALIFAFVKNAKARIAVPCVLLAAYWLVLALFTAPTDPQGKAVSRTNPDGSAATVMMKAADRKTDEPVSVHYARPTNVISWLDRTIMPNHLCSKGVYDPESPFSVPAGVFLAMLGMFAGAFLRREDVAGGRKALVLAGAAAASAAACLVSVLLLGTPIVKALWTPSFIFAAAAYSFAMLALFYWIVDVLGFVKWAFYFRVIGMNSILVYMLMQIGAFAPFKSFLFAGLGNAVPKAAASSVNGFCVLLVTWAILYFFYRKDIFVKV